MIVKKDESSNRVIEVDLTGPDGNAFVLMGFASRWCKDLHYSKEEREAVIDDMKSGDYDHLLEVIDKHFGRYVIFYR